MKNPKNTINTKDVEFCTNCGVATYDDIYYGDGSNLYPICIDCYDKYQGSNLKWPDGEEFDYTP